MALQQTTKIDQIQINEDGIIQIRQRTDIFDDVTPSIILASNYHRDSLNPGQDISGQDSKVIAIASVIWTPTIVAEYQAKIVTQISEQPLPTLVS